MAVGAQFMIWFIVLGVIVGLVVWALWRAVTRDSVNYDTDRLWEGYNRDQMNLPPKK